MLPAGIVKREVYISLYALNLATLRFQAIPMGASGGNDGWQAVGNLPDRVAGKQSQIFDSADPPVDRGEIPPPTLSERGPLNSDFIRRQNIESAQLMVLSETDCLSFTAVLNGGPS